MKKSLFLGIIAVMLIVPTVAFAAGHGTGAATVITAAGTDNTLNYNDAGGASKPQVTQLTDVTVTVTQEFGLANLNAPADQITTSGVTKVYTYTFNNYGNQSDSFSVSTSPSWHGITGTGWLITTDATGAQTISEGGQGTILVYVTPSSVAAESPNGSNVDVTTTVSTASKPAGVYTGGDGNSYGGTFEAFDTANTTIETSVMTITRTVTVDAPTLAAGYTGGAHDAVPGAAITYDITYNNTGAGAATSVILVDKVPTNTQGFTVEAIPGAVGNVNITDAGPDTNGSAWNVSYTTASSGVTFGYNDTNNWTSLGHGGTLPAGTTYVKWESASVAAGETGRVTWSVTIK